jgi:hypothetical protein
MAYTDIYTAATDAAHILRKQVAIGLYKAAIDIMNESASTADHAQRVAWSRRVISDPLGWSEKAIWKVLENPTIKASPTTALDSDVQFVCNSLVSSLMKAI